MKTVNIYKENTLWRTVEVKSLRDLAQKMMGAIERETTLFTFLLKAQEAYDNNGTYAFGSYNFYSFEVVK